MSEIKNHTQLLQALIDKYGLKSYLEIGAGNLGYLETVPSNPLANFNKIKCEYKVGVDPTIKDIDNDENNWYLSGEGSDDYFDSRAGGRNIDPFDLIFIDGLHHADQVKRDFENSLHCLSDNGFIVIHDVLPETEEGTIVPRQTKQWWGDVYKWAMNIDCYNGINFKTFNIDNGCMIVWKEKRTGSILPWLTPNWSDYLEAGKSVMNVTNEVTI